jgi:CheY-like chemotaxis protein
MLTILLVENNEMNRDMLSAAGLQGPFAVDGAEGIATALSSKPDLFRWGL